MIQEHQPHGDSHLASLARNESEFNLHWQDPERTVGSCALPVLNRFSVAMSLGMEMLIPRRSRGWNLCPRPGMAKVCFVQTSAGFAISLEIIGILSLTCSTL